MEQIRIGNVQEKGLSRKFHFVIFPSRPASPGHEVLLTVGHSEYVYAIGTIIVDWMPFQVI
jgi:hypothetical protein